MYEPDFAKLCAGFADACYGRGGEPVFGEGCKCVVELERYDVAAIMGWVEWFPDASGLTRLPSALVVEINGETARRVEVRRVPIASSPDKPFLVRVSARRRRTRGGELEDRGAKIYLAELDYRYVRAVGEAGRDDLLATLMLALRAVETAMPARHP